MKNQIPLLLLLICLSAFSQSHKLKLIRSDQTFIDPNLPNVTIAEGNVHVKHLGEGVSIKCDKAFFYKSSNTIKAAGNVFVNQGDTLYQKSEYTTYQGAKNKITSWGGVLIKTHLMELQTDSLVFDRNSQQLYFEQQGIIKDQTNTLVSKEGRYHLTSNLFEAIDSVSVINVDGSTLVSKKLEYYANTGMANIVAPTTITNNNNNSIYTEKGFYDTKNQVAEFKDNTLIKFNDLEIEGNDFFYENQHSFYHAKDDFKLTDAKNKLIIKGGYAELYGDKDSVFISDRAISMIEISPKDSVFLASDLLTMVGGKNKRKLTALQNVKFFKNDLQGVCGVIQSDEQTGIITFSENPIVWAKDTQITGDSIVIASIVGTKKLDSIKVFGNPKKKALVARKDSLSNGFNQLSGENIFGVFYDDQLTEMSIRGTPKSIIYLRDKMGKLIGVDRKEAKKSIEITFKEEGISSVSYLKGVTGTTINPSSAEMTEIEDLEGFFWHAEKRPMKKEDVFE
jgi:lipopolysaccharide export system protein LptA